MYSGLWHCVAGRVFSDYLNYNNKARPFFEMKGTSSLRMEQTWFFSCENLKSRTGRSYFKRIGYNYVLMRVGKTFIKPGKKKDYTLLSRFIANVYWKVVQIKEKKLHDLLSPIKSQFNVVNQELSYTLSVNTNFPTQITRNRKSDRSQNSYKFLHSFHSKSATPVRKKSKSYVLVW